MSPRTAGLLRVSVRRARHRRSGAWPRNRPRRGRRARATRGRRPTSTGSAPRTSSPGTRTSRCARRSLSEVYYPDLSTPAFRGLQFAVTDGKTFVDREVVDDDPRHIEPVAPGVTAHRDAARPHARLPAGDRERALAADQDLDHRPRARHRARCRCASRPRPGPRCALFVLADGAPGNDGNDDRGISGRARRCVAYDDAAASAVAASPALPADLERLPRHRERPVARPAGLQRSTGTDATQPGNVVQGARTALDGIRTTRTMTLAIGFGRDAGAADRRPPPARWRAASTPPRPPTTAAGAATSPR